MQPEIDVLGLPLKTFGMMFALGFIAAGAVIHRRMKELQVPADWAYEMIFAALLGGLVGLAALLDHREPRPRRRRRRPLRRHRPRLVRRRDRRRAVRRPLGALARLAERDDARRGGRAARARQRDRPDRLPALRRRRLRQAVGRAVGDGLPERHRPDRPGRDGPPDADLRDARDGPHRLGAVALRDRVRPGVLFALWLVLAGLERFLVEFLRRNEELARADAAAAAERRR